MSKRVALVGGAFDGQKVTLSATPRRITIGSETYERIDDPDTGAFLGGYAAPRNRPDESRTE